MAGGFDLAAVARLAAALCRGAAVEMRGLADNGDRAAVAVRGGRGVELAGNGDNAAVAAVEDDLATDLVGRGRDDLALHGNYIGDQIRRRSGGQHHCTARDLAVIDHQGFHRLAVLADGGGHDIADHRERHQPVAVEVHREHIGSAQRHRAQLGRNNAGIGHRRSDEADHAACSGRDGSLIDNLCVGIACLVEGRLAGCDVRIGRVTGGGDQ